MERREHLATPGGALQWDINNLVRDLRQERLFVSSEQQELQNLNERVVNDSSKLAQTAWVTSQQRLNLNRLVLARPDSSPATCCQRANALETTRFVDSYKVLPYQDCLAFGEFLQNLRASPELLAQCLAVGERVAAQQLAIIVPCLTSGLYGSLVLPQDTVLVLRLLRQLTRLQLVTSDNPRRMLRQGSCAFFRLYSAFHEGLFSAKLFLTAALQAPILQLLRDVEYFLDIDPDKAVVRFPPADRLQKFGEEGTPEYVARIARYRKWTVNSLVAITTRFINSLHENLHCFPAPLLWLIKQIAGFLIKSGNFSSKEVNAMITDLVFTHFICPAMVNPEPYGITDAPISYISRFNLIQVAQIIQMLALIKYQNVDVKVKDLYSMFDKDCVVNLLDAILHEATEILDEMPLAVDNAELQGMARSAAFFTETDLYNLIAFLQTISQSLAQTSEEASAIPMPSANINPALDVFSPHDRDKLTLLLSSLPPRPINGVKKTPSNDNLKIKRDCLDVSPDAPNKRHGILGKVSKPRINKANSVTTNLLNIDTNNINGSNGNDEASNHNHSSQSSSRPSSSGSEDSLPNANQEVLIIPLNVPPIELIGLLPEHKVLSMDLSNGFSSSSHLDTITLTNNGDTFISEQNSEERDQLVTDPNGLVMASGQEKRTRFSHSHDEGSIGNISDNLEAISEAASNHSVDSSLELEENEDQNDNDNLSDMISANVSGRGTPNISGRDTPSSQVTDGEGDGRQMGGEARQPFLPVAQPLINKQTRSDIDDKFCKFEIKKLLEGDETVSIISDTWSTDVLASDSETVEAGDRERLSYMPPVSERVERSNVVDGLDGLDAASESAWSTDVLASDSERMTEVDTDDTASVAPSDDTGSVARSDDTARSEIEDTPPVRLHRPIPISLPSHSSNMNASNHSDANTAQMNNGPISASSSQPSSPLDGSSIQMNNFNPFMQHSANFNIVSNPNFSPSNAFRPIREDRDSITPNSPIRHDNTPPNINVTGKGGSKADYRRRTLEYVDNNANSIHAALQIERNCVTTEQSILTRSETVEQHPSILRNSTSHVLTETTHRREAILVDSNSVSSNGLELLLQEKDRSSTNSFKMGGVPGTAGPSGMMLTNSSPMETIGDIGLANHARHCDIKIRNGDNEISDIVVRLSNASLNSTSSSIGSSSSSSDTNKPSNQINNGNIFENWEHFKNGCRSTWFQNGADANISSTPTEGTSDFRSGNVIESPISNTVNQLDESRGIVSSGVQKIFNVAPSSAIKPCTSTGAIPKSISFDMTAVKGDKDLLDDEQKNKRGFFGKLKMGFRNRRGKSLRADELVPTRYENGDSDPTRFRRYTSLLEERSLAMAPSMEESSEDILAKYRRKPSETGDVNLPAGAATNGSSSSSKAKDSVETNGNLANGIQCNHDERWTIDHSNVEASFAFADAKRKLRLVLSTASEQTVTWDIHIGRGGRMQNLSGASENELVSFLRLQLAKARNLCDWPLVALIGETLRCVSLFDVTACRKLLLALRQEHMKRGAYIRYLVHCRQELLSTLAHIDGLYSQITSDRELSSSYLVTVCVRMFLERREPLVLQFCDEFQNLTLADEKTDLLVTFMRQLTDEMEKDINWREASESQMMLARIAIERTLISRVYIHGLYPNGDVDASRDRLFHTYMRKLSKVVTPNHKDLPIHKIFHYECPWTAAQEAISAISAYKTPQDKVRCVVRCATSIMNLLSIASDRSVPTADDFTPVLVYVLIKANPPSLLSTIQYVNSFYGNRLQGEDQYWWIQFCSAVEFIKTMEYSD